MTIGSIAVIFKNRNLATERVADYYIDSIDFNKPKKVKITEESFVL